MWVYAIIVCCQLLHAAHGTMRFTRNMDDFSLEENIAPDTFLYQLRATVQGGGGNNAEIVYGFNGKNDDSDLQLEQEDFFLKINRSTGVVTHAAVDMDFEGVLENQWNFNLMAKLADNSDFVRHTSRVTLNNINDEKPRFLDADKKFVNESEAVPPGGRLLFQDVTATDEDQIIITPDKNYVQAKIDGCRYANGSSDDCGNLFRLVQTTYSTYSFVGDIYLMGALDFEFTPIIVIQLSATDGQFTGNGEVSINIRNVQDQNPRWIILPTTVKIFENHHLSVRVEAEDGDNLGRPIWYRYKQDQINLPDLAARFIIDPESGVISNVTELDAEAPLFREYFPDVRKFNWNLQIEACEYESLNPLVLTDQCITGVVTIQLLDENDNAPLHTPLNVYNYYLFENEPNDRALELPPIQIFDRDTEPFAQYRTVLVQESQEFFVIGGAGTNPSIGIKGSQLLDMDTPPREYFLTLLTYDLNDPSLNSTAEVNIYLMDINDNAPQFPQDEYYAEIYEDVDSGYRVLAVQARDIDFDSIHHGQDSIQYSILGAYANLFHMNRETGVLTVKDCDTSPSKNHGRWPCIDFDESVTEYFLLIEAADNKSSNFALYGTARLTIQVLGVNDNPPEVPSYDRTIREGRTSFNPRLQVVAKDKDSKGAPTNLMYSISSQVPGDLWRINPQTGIITAHRPVMFTDGNVDGEFVVEVEVTDGLFTVQGFVYIRVLDENDNAPRFFQDEYEVWIDETIPPGTFILQLEATDEDDPTTKNGQLSLNIEKGNVGGKFQLNQNGSFHVADNATFDFNQRDLYTIVAVVVDGGTPQLVGRTTIIVHIRDKNNKSPKVEPFLQPFQCYENWNRGRYVGVILAEDPDVDAQIRFEFVRPMRAFTDNGQEITRGQYPFEDIFALDYETGVITVNTDDLDSERTRDLTFRVRVTDITPTAVQEGFGTITIEVLPFNQIRPYFTNFTQPIIIPEEMPRGSLVVSLIARDENNGIRHYDIIEQPDDFFSISRNTGSVNIKNTVDYDDFRRINESYFVAWVEDTGVPPLTATLTVRVQFENINDVYPVFVNPVTDEEQEIYEGYINENSPSGTPVTIVKALDGDRPDANGFHLVRYFMEDDRFMVNPINGNVTVRLQGNQVLDREVTDRIQALVTVRDNPDDPTNQNQAAAQIYIYLRDENDNPPIFSKLSYEVTIYETINVGTPILQVFTTDLDIGPHAESVYTKIDDQRGNDYLRFFDVLPVSGRVVVNKSLARHSREEPYVFYVQAQDNRGTGHKAEAKVSVFVKQALNAPPRWVIPAKANMTIYVLESQYKGMLVFDVKAEDDDTGVNGLIDYSFIYEGQNTQRTPEFEINRVNGMIHAQIVYDRERVDRYVLLLKATDRGKTPLEATRFLTIVVKDVNDNPPVFENSEIEFRVSEDEPKGFFVGQVTATDLDLNPVIHYEIISKDNTKFAIDRDTGAITLAEMLDSEHKRVYYFDVMARNEEPEYTVIHTRKRRAVNPSIITVKVLVSDFNDFAPVFLQDSYYGCVSTRSPFNKHILSVKARDLDAEGTGIVRYRMVDGNTDGDKLLFDVHPKFGVLRNKVLMKQYADRIFTMQVNARDGESIEDSESSNVPVIVAVTQPGKEVKLLITQNTGEVRLYQSQIQSIIEEAEDLDYLCINEIDDHVTQGKGYDASLWSDVYVSGIRRNDRGELVIVSGIELKNIISRELHGRKQDFDLLYIKEVELASSSDEIRLKDKAVLIILIIIAVLIFLVIIFCIVAFMCIRAAKKQKKQILVHRTHATPAPVIMAEEPIVEPVVYDNRTFIQEVVHKPEPEPIVENVRIVEPVHVPEPNPEPVYITTTTEQEVIGPEPVHIQYAVVQKRQPSYDEEVEPQTIVVELDEDETREPDVYIPSEVVEPSREYRIVTEVQE